MSIDLHTHTNFSDGSLSPEALVDLAIKKKTEVLAITDHDEVGAIHPAMQYSNNFPIEIVAGVELSIEYQLQGHGHLHILGLFIDYNNEELITNLDKLKQARYDRIKIMVQKVKALGFDLDVNELEKYVGQGSAGRPHLARILVEKDIVKDIPDAFSKYLSKGRPALPIIAHPYSLGYATYPEMGREILKLKAMGLDGLEAYYTSYNVYLTNWLLKFAKENNMLISGGSDFHGEPKPEIQLGSGSGNLSIPYSVYEKLINYINY